MESGANMTAKAINMRSELNPQSPDWFDENHDSLLILQGRDYDENGVSPQPESSCHGA